MAIISNFPAGAGGVKGVVKDKLRTGASQPVTDYSPMLHAYNGRIYAIGAKNTMFIYTIATDTWTTNTGAPVSVTLDTSQLYNGKIYCPVSGDKLLYIYNIATDTWSTGAAPPTSATRDSSALYNGKIYCPASGASTLHIYDIATNSWTTGAAAPDTGPRTFTALYNGKLYCPVQGALCIYNIATNSWTSGPSLPHSDVKVTVVHEGKLYGMAYPTKAMYIYDTSLNSWSTGASAPTTGNQGASQLYNGRIYYPADTTPRAMYIYDIATNTWTSGAGPCAMTSSILYNGNLYGVGYNRATLYIYAALAFE